MNNLPKIVIFDWDGTIVDTRQCIVQSINHVLKSYNLPFWEECKSLKIIEKNNAFKSNLKNIFKKEFNKAFDLYRMTYLKSFKNLVKVFPDSRETINFIKSKGIKIHIVSNKDSILLNEEIKFLFGENFFDNVLGYDDCPEQKPSTKVVERSLFEHKGIDRSKDVIFVGDGEIDILCAMNSKCIPILLFAYNFPFQNYKKCTSIVSFKDLHKYFLLLNHGINTNQ